MRKLFAVLALLALPVVAAAQPYTVNRNINNVTPISASLVAADSDVALVIKYFPGPGQGSGAITPTVAVEADGNLTFTVAAVAYAGFECPFSGALGGVLDVSDAECNTAGEVVQIINSTPISFATGYFRAALVGALASDVLSTQAWLPDAADTDVGRPDLGEVIYWDSSALDDNTATFFDDSLGASAFIGTRNVAKNPFADTDALIAWVRATSTNAGTVGDVTVSAVKSNYGSGGGCNSGTDCGSYSEVVRTVVVEAHATTEDDNLSAEFPDGFFVKGEKVIVRIDATGADTSVIGIQITGYTWPSER
jgi:hypothetical protein